MISLLACPPARPIALLLRHAERPDIPQGASGHHLPITDAGALDASRFGARLGSRLRAVRSSPVPRCLQTAEAIVRGAETTLPVVSDTMLGDPGPFVIDPELGLKSFISLGQDHVFRCVVNGDGQIPGFAEPRQAARQLLSHLLSSMQSAPGFYVFVSHDLVLAGLLARVFHLPVLGDDWPGFLETVAIWQNDATSLELAFRSHRSSTSLVD